MKTWTRSETLALAKQACTFCYGLGLRPGRAGRERACGCVYRAIFRICHNRFRYCVTNERAMGCVRLERAGQGRKQGRNTWGMRNEEYAADFLLLAKRILGEKTHLHNVFAWHFLYGADFRLINRKLGRPLSDRMIFHDFYRVEEKLGRACAELEPYPLYPLREYFGISIDAAKTAKALRAFEIESEPPEPLPLRFPFKIKAAA